MTPNVFGVRACTYSMLICISLCQFCPYSNVHECNATAISRTESFPFSSFYLIISKHLMCLVTSTGMCSIRVLSVDTIQRPWRFVAGVWRLGKRNHGVKVIKGNNLTYVDGYYPNCCINDLLWGKSTVSLLRYGKRFSGYLFSNDVLIHVLVWYPSHFCLPVKSWLNHT